MSNYHLRISLLLVLASLMIGGSRQVLATESNPNPLPLSNGAVFASGFTASTTASGNFTYVGTTHTVQICDADANTALNLVGDDTLDIMVYQFPTGTTVNGGAGAANNPALVAGLINSFGPVTLNETTLGCFTGSFLNTNLAGLVPNRQIVFTYPDTTVPSGASPFFSVVKRFTVGTTDSMVVNPASASRGTNITITVTDLDRNLNAGAGNDTPIGIGLVNQTASPGFPIALTMPETGPGVFSITLPNNDPRFDDTPGAIIPRVGDTISIWYDPPYKSNAVTVIPADRILRTHVVTGVNASLSVTVASPSVAAGNTLYGTGHTLTLVDADANLNSGPGNDNVTIQIIQPNNPTDNLCTATVTLTETSSAGTFTNATPYVIADSPGAPANCDWSGGGADYKVNGEAGAQIRFRYVDFSNTGTTVNRDVTFNIVSVAAVLTVSPTEGGAGASVTLTIQDTDRNLIGGAGNDTAGTLRVGIRRASPAYVTAIGARVPISLTETGQGVFTGTLSTNLINDGVETAMAGDILEFFYTDPIGGTGIVNQVPAPASPNGTHRINASNGSVTVSPDPVSPTTLITVTVTDSDLNLNTVAADTYPAPPSTLVEVFQQPPAGVATSMGYITVTETGPSTSIFRGTFELPNLPIGTLVFARYYDQQVPSGGGVPPVTRNSNTVTVQAQLASLNVPDQYQLNSTVPLTIRITDSDENSVAGPGNNDLDAGSALPTVLSITKLTNCTGACTQNIADPQPAPYAGFVNGDEVEASIFQRLFTFAQLDGIAWGAPDNAIVVGDRFRVIYYDEVNISGATSQITRDFVIVGAQTAVLDATPALVNLGGLITVTLTDLDRNLTAGGSNDTVIITFRNQTKMTPVKNLTLYETSTAGVFRAEFASSNAEWQLNPSLNDIIRFTYIDPQPVPAGGNTFTDDVRIAQLGNVATISVTNTVPGRPIEITVIDLDLTSVSSIKVKAVNLNTGEEEKDIVLNQIDSATGTFRGLLNTAYGLGSDGASNGVIAVKGGDVVRFSYVDEINNTGAAVTLTADSNIVDRRTDVLFCDRGTQISNPTWRGEYFNNKTLQGTPVVVVDEVHLSVNWEETAPFGQINADGWSARWTTTIQVTQNGKFRFRLGADDGIRFWVDDTLLVDQFTNGSFRTFFADVSLAPGMHRIRVEYFEDTGGAGVLADCQYTEAPVTAIDPDGNTVEVFPSDVDLTEATAHITTGRINVRANPNVNSPRIAYVYIYDRYPIRGITDDGQWLLIQLKDGRTGWISSQFVKRYEEIPVQIYPSDSGSAAALPNVEVAAYALVEINIRDIPRGDNVIGVLPQGAAFRVLSRTSSGAWLKIRYEGIEGWVLNLPEYIGFTNGTVQDLPRE